MPKALKPCSVHIRSVDRASCRRTPFPETPERRTKQNERTAKGTLACDVCVNSARVRRGVFRDR